MSLKEEMKIRDAKLVALILCGSSLLHKWLFG